MAVRMLMEWAHQLFKLYVGNLQLTYHFSFVGRRQYPILSFFLFSPRNLGFVVSSLIQQPMEKSIGLLQCIR